MYLRLREESKEMLRRKNQICLLKTEIQKAKLAARIKIEQERKAKLESESKLSPEKQPSQT